MSNPNSRLVTGWLDPEGKMYECEIYDHNSYAADLVKQYNYEQIREDFRLLSSDEILLKHGWVHITRTCGYLHHIPCWRIGWSFQRHLTVEQKAFLAPCFETGESIYPLDKDRWEEEQ